MAADPEKKSEFVDSAHMHMIRHNSKNMVNPIPRVKDDLKGSITDKNRELAVEKCQIVPLQTVKNS